jgi:hypothetical protein
VELEGEPPGAWTLWNRDDLVGTPPLDLRIDPGVVALSLRNGGEHVSQHMLYTVEAPRRGARTVVVLQVP